MKTQNEVKQNEVDVIIRQIQKQIEDFCEDRDENHFVSWNLTDRGFVMTTLHIDDFRQIQHLTDEDGGDYSDFFRGLSQQVEDDEVSMNDKSQMNMKLVKILNQLKHPMVFHKNWNDGLVFLVRRPQDEFGCRFHFISQ